MEFNVNGFKVATEEQARVMLLTSMLKKNVAEADLAYYALRMLQRDNTAKHK